MFECRFATRSVDKDGAICNHEEEEPGSDLDVCNGDAAIYIHTTTFASNEETTSGKAGPRVDRGRYDNRRTGRSCSMTRWKVNNTACFECGNPMKQRMLATSLIRQQQQQRICLPYCRAPFSPHKRCPRRGTHTLRYTWNPRIAEGNTNSFVRGHVLLALELCKSRQLATLFG